jgi:hypothetical protein
LLSHQIGKWCPFFLPPFLLLPPPSTLSGAAPSPGVHDHAVPGYLGKPVTVAVLPPRHCRGDSFPWKHW